MARSQAHARRRLAEKENIRFKVISIFIEPPGDNITEKKEVLEERLKSRADTPITLIKKRLKRLDLELEYKDNFQHHFVNYDLEETTNDIEKTIKEHLDK